MNANGEAGIRNWIISVFFTEVYKAGTHFWWHFFYLDISIVIMNITQKIRLI